MLTLIAIYYTISIFSFAYYFDYFKLFNSTNNDNESNKEFDFQSYCFRKTNNWKWKPLFIIYNSILDQNEYFDSQLNDLVHNITWKKIQNFKTLFNQRTKY
jgi:hypothetical protein